MSRAFDPDDSDPNFDKAWLADLALIRQITLEEKQAEDDRAFAGRLGGVTVDAIPNNLRRRAILVDDFDDNTDNGNEQTTETTRTYNRPKQKRCAACMEFVTKKDPPAPCGDTYCVGCLKQLFTASLQDETLMPPRCCRKEIPIALAQLTPMEIEEFNAKRLEYSTVDRLYCSQPTCSTFIPPALIVNSVGTCPKLGCGITTCSICKAASHDNLDCPEDAATSAVLETAREAGWTRCYRCRALVELTQGCYHMTCRCHSEFCYLCSIPWKNCKCVQWDEARLLEEARDRTNRAPVPGIPPAAERLDLNQRVQQVANQLRANYECRHTAGWVYTRGGGRCEECNDYLSQYLFRCSGCQFMACNRCRHNRLG